MDEQDPLAMDFFDIFIKEIRDAEKAEMNKASKKK